MDERFRLAPGLSCFLPQDGNRKTKEYSVLAPKKDTPPALQAKSKVIFGSHGY